MVHAALFFIITIIMLRISKVYYKTFFTPLGVYAVVWGTLLSLYFINPLDFWPPSSKTINIFWLSYILFCAGCIFIRMTKPRSFPKNMGLINRVNRLKLKRIIWSLSLIGFLGSILFFFLVARTYGISTWMKNPWVVRLAHMYGESSGYSFSLYVDFLIFELIRGCIYASAILGSIHIAFLKRNYLPAYIPIFSVLIFDALFLGRLFTFDIMIIYICGHLITKQILPKDEVILSLKAQKKAAFIIVCLMISWVLFISFKLEKFRFERDEFLGLGVPQYVARSVFPFTASFAAFDYVINQEYHEFHWGRHTFYPIDLNLRRLSSMLLSTSWQGANIDIYEHNVPISDSRNERAFFTYLRTFFEDFGIVGTLLCPFLLGTLATYFYQRMIETKRIIYILLTNLLILFLISSVLRWRFIEPYFLFTLILLIGIGSVLKTMHIKRPSIEF